VCSNSLKFIRTSWTKGYVHNSATHGRLTLSLPESVMETLKVILTLEPVNESCGVTIQMKPHQQYFHMVLFIFNYFTKCNLGFVINLCYCVWSFEVQWKVSRSSSKKISPFSKQMRPNLLDTLSVAAERNKGINWAFIQQYSPF